MFNRSRRNIARWFTLSMGSILITFAGVVYYLRAEDNLESLDRLLYNKAKIMATSVEYEVQGGEWQVDLTKMPLLGYSMAPPGSELIYARWYDTNGELVRFFGSPPTAKQTTSGFQTIKTPHDSMVLTPSTSWLREVTLPVQENNQVIGYLQIALPLSTTQDNLTQFRLLMTLSLPIALGLIGMTGWILSGIAMQPIHQAYDQLQRFTADASHELRTPTSAILSNAQVGLLTAQDHHAAADIVPQLQLRLENIVETAQSMRTLITNLLFLARHQGGLATERLQSFDLNELLQDLVDDYAAQPKTRDLKLMSDLPADEVLIKADPDLLRQALCNLLSNACKYTPAGGIVVVQLRAHPHHVLIQVEDNGIGIPAQDLPHIFERFYRVDTERARSSGGVGLGLAITHQIVEAHGGRIKVSSVLSQGSSFQIELPV